MSFSLQKKPAIIGCHKTGVPQSTLSTIMKCEYPSMKLRIIYEVCDGLEINLEDFFNSDVFKRENIEEC